MFRIMTYDEMIEFLNSLDKNVIKEEKTLDILPMENQ